MLEKDIENSILCFLEDLGTWAWKNPSIGLYDVAKKTYRKPKGRFHQRGTPDIIMIHNKQTVFIEVKGPKGRLSPEQQAFLIKAEQRLVLAFVARSVMDVWDHIAHIFTENELKNVMHIVRKWQQIEEFEAESTS